eukprot:350655-Chlamydomonas_euryale.AAC.2
MARCLPPVQHPAAYTVAVFNLFAAKAAGIAKLYEHTNTHLVWQRFVTSAARRDPPCREHLYNADVRNLILERSRRYYARLGRINALEPAMMALSDEQLSGMTGAVFEFRAPRCLGGGGCLDRCGPGKLLFGT